MTEGRYNFWEPEEEVQTMKEPNDRSFIIVLDRIKEQALEAVTLSDPSVENQVIDGYKQGKYDMIREVIKAYKKYG